MQPSFELFDLISGNVYDVHDRESESINALLAMMLERGPDAVARFALRCDRDGDSSLIAMEQDLVRLVEAKKDQLMRAQP